MLTRCLSCYAHFPANDRVEHLPSGRRFAFDPHRGRLWLLCDACSGWTLVPIEERWEGVESLERLVHDHGRLLTQTANIALYDARGIRVVLDAVFNHCSNLHPFFLDVKAKGKDSPYWNWFFIKQWPIWLLGCRL